ncbi:MAG TPA: indole-3-glycerol phosphate synthase TrpC [Phycisphaerae bacterium]|nr:indole-3-glycerol phosphate synthase TrpC [Phycisphaerae bacterium]
MSGTILEKIVETKRGEVAEAKRARPLAAIQAAIESAQPARDLLRAVTGGGDRVCLIAEIKKRSPSAGLIRADFDPVALARLYEGAGAAALSVLTDAEYFSGELAFIAQIKRAVGLPVLRKDFIIDEYQVYESRAAGADAVLLIAEILTAEQIGVFGTLAERMGMSALVEVHDAKQLAAVRGVLASSRRMILGINNRDLKLQRVDLETTRRLAGLLPRGTPFVAESGIARRADVEAMREAGASAVLVGEALLREQDIPGKIREMFA